MNKDSKVNYLDQISYKLTASFLLATERKKERMKKAICGGLFLELNYLVGDNWLANEYISIQQYVEMTHTKAKYEVITLHQKRSFCCCLLAYGYLAIMGGQRKVHFPLFYLKVNGFVGNIGS